MRELNNNTLKCCSKNQKLHENFIQFLLTPCFNSSIKFYETQQHAHVTVSQIIAILCLSLCNGSNFSQNFMKSKVCLPEIITIITLFEYLHPNVHDNILLN